MWIIDFGVDTPEEEAALYEAPFEYVATHVKPVRETNRRASYAKRWWLHVEPRSGDAGRLADSRASSRRQPCRSTAYSSGSTARRCLTTSSSSSRRDDDYFFGVLHSAVHELWARGMGTQLREVESGFRYTPTTTFETFPFPDATAQQRNDVAAAAKRSTNCGLAG